MRKKSGPTGMKPHIVLDLCCQIALQKCLTGSSYCDAAETNLTTIHEDVGSNPGLAQWVRVQEPALLYITDVSGL